MLETGESLSSIKNKFCFLRNTTNLHIIVYNQYQMKLPKIKDDGLLQL